MDTRLRIWAACGLASVLAAGTALGDGGGKSIIIARTETDCLLTSSRRTADAPTADGKQDTVMPSLQEPGAGKPEKDKQAKAKNAKIENDTPLKIPSKRTEEPSELKLVEPPLRDDSVKPVLFEDADWIVGACEGLPVVGPPLFGLRQRLSSSGCQEGCDDACCERRVGGYGFAVIDGWKGRVDNDHNNNFGPRGGVNLGALLLNNLGGQLGVSYSGYDLHGRELDEERSVEDQLFITAGVFKHATCCCPNARWLDRISAGFVYDQMIADNLGDRADYLTVGQVRGRVGFALDGCNELGVWGASGIEPRNLVRPGLITEGMDQISGFWHHKWQYCAETTFWAGVAEDPGEVTFGFQGEAPLNDRVSLFGSFHYILPSTSGGDTPDNAYSEEFWSVSFGVTVYLRGCGRTNNVMGHRWMPLLPVADNGSFALELPGGQ